MKIMLTRTCLVLLFIAIVWTKTDACGPAGGTKHGGGNYGYKLFTSKRNFHTDKCIDLITKTFDKLESFCKDDKACPSKECENICLYLRKSSCI